MRRSVGTLAIILLSTGVLGGIFILGTMDQGVHESCPLTMGFCLDAVGHLSGFAVLFSSFIASLTLLLVPRLFSEELRTRPLRLSSSRTLRCVLPVRHLKWLALLEKRDPEGVFAGA